jgi:Trk K+ transport system NAD-binding subunit
MEEIWIIGIGQFGYIAFQRLSEAGKDRQFVLVDSAEKKLRRCKGATAALERSSTADRVFTPELSIPAT